MNIGRKKIPEFVFITPHKKIDGILLIFVFVKYSGKTLWVSANFPTIDKGYKMKSFFIKKVNPLWLRINILGIALIGILSREKTAEDSKKIKDK